MMQTILARQATKGRATAPTLLSKATTIGSTCVQMYNPKAAIITINAAILHTAERNKETMERSSLSFCRCSLGIAVSLQPFQPVSMVRTQFPIDCPKIVST